MTRIEGGRRAMTVTMTRVENQTCGAAVKLPSYIAGHTKHRVCSAMIFSMRGGGR